jgi:nicotinic acetylcholine receptor
MTFVVFFFFLFLDCCPEIYVDLTFHIHLERRGGFYNYILILPCVLLSCLTCILFWLPVREKSII